MGAWTTRADVIAKLRRRWTSGEFLAAFAADQPWEPLNVPLRGPGPRDLAANLGAVQEWAQAWRDTRLLRVEYQTVGGRLIGGNDLPRRVWIDSWPQLWSLLAVAPQVKRFTSLHEATRAIAPSLAEWMLTKPHTVLALEAAWPKIVEAVLWIDHNGDPTRYLRQIDVPGVDTKFVEAHQEVITKLLDRQLDPSRIDLTLPASRDFAGRYGLRRKPRYVRFRWLRHTDGFSEVTVRAEELALRPLDVTTVFIIENETTYLAFPDVPNAAVIFGGGYAVTQVNDLAWLHERELVYWGDIDTHGFAILNRLRTRFPAARSMLMDRATLLAHEGQWVTEKTKTTDDLPGLRPAESALYRDLVEDTFGPSIRLEQERVRYSAIEAAVHIR